MPKVLGYPYGTSTASLSLKTENGSTVVVPAVDAATDSGTSAPRIVWRPDGTGDAATWADVVGLMGSKIAVEIFCDQAGGAYTIPAGVYEVNEAFFVAPEGPNLIVLQPADGVQLANLAGMTGGIAIQNVNTVLPLLTFPRAIAETIFPVFTMRGFECAISQGGTAPVFSFSSADTSAFFLQLLEGAFLAEGEVPQPIISLTGVMAVIFASSCFATNTVPSSSVAGDALSALVFFQDGTLNLNGTRTFPAFLGTVSNAAYSVAGGQGPTTFRPDAFFNPIPTGCTFFDTDLQEQVVWNGSAWDAIVDGRDAFTTTAAPFNIPALDALVTVQVLDTSWMQPNMWLLIGGSYLLVNSVTDGTHVSVVNSNRATGTAVAGTTIASGQPVDPAGAPGVDAFAFTEANFTVPAVSANVVVSSGGTGGSQPTTTFAWMAVGQVVFIETAGYYRVAVGGASSVTLTNLGTVGNAAPTTVITAGRHVSPAGEPAPTSDFQFWCWTGAAAAASAAARFLYAANSAQAPQAVEGNSVVTSGIAGNFTEMHVTHDTAITDTVTYTLRINGVNTTLTCTVAGSGTTASITGQSIPFSKGDKVSLQSQQSGTAAQANLLPRATVTYV